MSFIHWQTSRAFVAGLALAGAALASAPAAAQDSEARLRKLEAEVRALQRSVFDGDDRFFTPEVLTPDSRSQPQRQSGAPTETAVTDILARLDALETQLARLTALGEVNQNAIAQIEERLDAMQAQPAVPAVNEPTGALPLPPASSAGEAPAAAAGPDPERLARVQAIVKPDTGDAGEDEYTYGFRLWEAGFFPEAQQQLKLYVEQQPTHRMISFGRNLLGRAYLDAGQPREAAPYFLENYQKDPNGARAPDSLLFLAEAMIALEDTSRACRALAEFGEKYPALATGRLQNQYDRNRRRVSCG